MKVKDYFKRAKNLKSKKSLSEGLKVVRLGLELDPKHEGLIKLAAEIK